MKNSQLIETGNSVKEMGYGNKVYSDQGVLASAIYPEFMGKEKRFDFNIKKNPFNKVKSPSPKPSNN